MSQESAEIYHILAFEFVGQDRARQVVDLLRQAGKAQNYKVKAWAVVGIDDKGKAHVQQSGHGGKGTAAGAGVGALLGLVGGPAGLLVWTVGGALLGGVAGKYLGHQFDKNQIEALAAGMEPNSSAIIAVVQNKAAEEIANDLGEYDARVVTLTMGSQLSGEVATYAAIDLGEEGEAVDAPAADAPAADAPAAEGEEAAKA